MTASPPHPPGPEVPQAATPSGCAHCRGGAPLDFEFAFAFQPIVNLREGGIFAHEALVRGPNGEGAASVLARVNADNRYRFDQAARVKAIATAAALGLSEAVSINFLPNAVYQPQLCIRTTLQAAQAHGFPLERIIFEPKSGS